MPHRPGRPPSIHIYSDGTTGSTRVVGPDGQPITNIKSLEVFAEADTREFTVRLELTGAMLDLDGPVQGIMFSCPLCDHQRQHTCGQHL